MNNTKGLKRIPVVNIQMIREKNIYYKSKKLISYADSFNFFKSYLGNMDREVFIVACLNAKNEIIAVNTCHIGSLDSTVVHPREVFKAAILANAFYIICAHNHPSGDPEPSKADIDITVRLKKAGNILGIDLLDHIIIGDEKFYSMKDNGTL